MKFYTKEELAQRNGKILSDIWIAYKGKIYDVTSSDLFEGGRHFKLSTGIDLTNEMEDAPHTETVLEKFNIIGFLKD